MIPEIILAVLGIVSTVIAYKLNPNRRLDNLYKRIDKIYDELEKAYAQRDKGLADNDSDNITLATAYIRELHNEKALLLQRSRTYNSERS